MYITSQVGIRQIISNREEQTEGSGSCTRLWDCFVMCVFNCCLPFLERVTVADRTPNNNVQRWSIGSINQNEECLTVSSISVVSSESYSLAYRDSVCPGELSEPSGESGQASCMVEPQESDLTLSVAVTASDNTHPCENEKMFEEDKKKREIKARGNEIGCLKQDVTNRPERRKRNWRKVLIESNPDCARFNRSHPLKH